MLFRYDSVWYECTSRLSKVIYVRETSYSSNVIEFYSLSWESGRKLLSVLVLLESLGNTGGKAY